MSEPSQFVTLTFGPQETSIEYQWLNAENTQAPLMVFLHEGLGSVAMWKQFPKQLCDALKCRGLVYSRSGYGRSSPRLAYEKWDTDFMHQQAYEVLPSLFSALDVDTNTNPPWLFGHSDGGSIALLYAAKYPDQLAGAIVLAPHIMVEAITVKSIKQARTVYLETNLREKLGRYHDDVDSAFWGWNDIWLDSEFLSWSIEGELDNILCPLLAIQGQDDEYGSLEQIHGVKQRVEHAELLELAECGHSAHKDQAGVVISEVCRFLQKNNSKP